MFEGAEIIKSSGNRLPDKTALGIALLLSPIPALPAGKNSVILVVSLASQFKDCA